MAPYPSATRAMAGAASLVVERRRRTSELTCGYVDESELAVAWLDVAVVMVCSLCRPLMGCRALSNVRAAERRK